MLLIASSPYSQRGELYNAYRRHFGRDGARVLVWKASTQEMNPGIDRRIIDEAYEDDPELAKAEYGGEFRTDLADYISRETVDAVTMWGRHELPPVPGVTYSAFVDPSGGVSDSMTLAIGHLGRNNACVLDAALEVRPPLDPEQTVAAFAVMLRRYGVTKIFGDKYAGEWPRARFAEHGIEFEQSARPKSDLYRTFCPSQRPSRRVARPATPIGPACRPGAAHGAQRQGRSIMPRAPMTIWPMRSPAFWSASTSTAGSRWSRSATCSPPTARARTSRRLPRHWA